MANTYKDPPDEVIDIDGIDLAAIRYAIDFCRSNLQTFTDKYDLDLCDEDMIYLMRMFDGAKSVNRCPYYRPTRKKRVQK